MTSTIGVKRAPSNVWLNHPTEGIGGMHWLDHLMTVARPFTLMHSWNVIPLVQWKRHIYRHQQCNSHQDPCLRKAQICTAANMHMILILQVWSTQWDHLTLHCQACQPSDQCSSWDPAKSDHWRWPQWVIFSPANSTSPKTHQTATPIPTIKAALDSGASANCFPASCKGTNDWPVLPVKTARAQVANYGLISSTATDELASTQLPPISEQVDECNEMTTPYCQSMNCAKVTLQSSFEVRKPLSSNQQHLTFPFVVNLQSNTSKTQEQNSSQWIFMLATPRHANFSETQSSQASHSSEKHHHQVSASINETLPCELRRITNWLSSPSSGKGLVDKLSRAHNCQSWGAL